MKGITPHIDNVHAFEEEVLSVSLGSPCVMEFQLKGSQDGKTLLLLEAGSVILLTGDARYKYTHCIPNRKTDKWQGQTIKRERRVSVTLRRAKVGKE